MDLNWKTAVLTALVFIFWSLPQALATLWPAFTDKKIPDWIRERRWGLMTPKLYGWFSLAIGITLTAIACIALYNTTKQRDEALENTMTQRDEAVQIAKQAVQTANQIMGIITNNIIPTQIALERFLFPRRLTGEHMKKMSEYLKNYTPRTMLVRVLANDGEAEDYARDFERPFRWAGWNVSRVTATNAPQGMSVNLLVKDPPGPRQTNQPDSHALVIEAMRNALLRTPSGGASSDLSVTEDTLIVTIGARRRDSMADQQSWVQ